MHAKPQKEHKWLEKLVGEWNSVAEMSMAAGEPTMTFNGTETVRSLGGLWTLGEGEGEMPGGDIGKTMLTLGYDPSKQRFVGTWIGSMMTHMWIYDGKLDASGKVLTLDSEGPSMKGDGKMAKYRDIVEFKNRNHRLLHSEVLGSNRKWQRFMTAHYRRKK
ncbi:MAG: DUF1579 domain-containing protein [Verrucomicrobiales bacterium]|nr:DUF1579 domain-containing protein [Verrucomicrobiales bacterium]